MFVCLSQGITNISLMCLFIKETGLIAQYELSETYFFVKTKDICLVSLAVTLLNILIFPSLAVPVVLALIYMHFLFIYRDQLGEYMESIGAPSPGIMTLTSFLSKVHI